MWLNINSYNERHAGGVVKVQVINTELWYIRRTHSRKERIIWVIGVMKVGTEVVQLAKEESRLIPEPNDEYCASPCLFAEMHTTWRESHGGGSDLDTRPIFAPDEMQEFEERWYSPCPAAWREHVMRQVVTVILRLGVVPQKVLDVTPRALYCVGVDLWSTSYDYNCNCNLFAFIWSKKGLLPIGYRTCHHQYT